MASRAHWEPLPMEYLASERDAAIAAKDMHTLALLKEICRLHGVLLKAYHYTRTATAPGGQVRINQSLLSELHERLQAEPVVLKDNQKKQELLAPRRIPKHDMVMQWPGPD